MKKKYGLAILCAVLLFCAVLVSPAFAQMTKVDEAELAEANASLTGRESPEVAGAEGAVDKTGSVLFTSTSEATDSSRSGSTLNYLPASGPEKIFYDHPWANNGTNQWYWNGGTTSVWHRSNPSR
jgi:hypothetical protein